MTLLREQLHLAREAYLQASYPGDLLADLAERQARRWVMRLAGVTGAAAAIAAAILISIMLLHPRTVTGPSTPLALKITPTQIPAMPALPQGISLVAPHQSLADIPAMGDMHGALSEVPFTADDIPYVPVTPNWGLSL